MKIKPKIILILLAVLSVFNFNTVSYAESLPEVHAGSVVLGELSTGKIIYSKNADEKMYPASMTKILTALVAVDYYDYDSLITVGDEVNQVPYDSSKAGHTRGETLSVLNLIRGLVIPSGNDTSAVIASAVAKKVSENSALEYSECEKLFSGLMNKKAKDLGAFNSNFVNPHGYHDENHYSTANDIFKLSRVFCKNPTFMEIAGESLYAGTGADKDLIEGTSLVVKNYYWKTHNLLLTEGDYYYEYATGIKTGFTDEAGDCLIASAEKDGVSLIAVIFNSEDPNRWLDAINLFEYGFNNYKFETVDLYGSIVDSASLKNQEKDFGDSVDVEIRKKVTLFLNKDELKNIERKITYFPEYIYTPESGGDTPSELTLKAPIEKLSPIGTIQYSVNGNILLDEEPVYSKYTVPESTKVNISEKIQDMFKNLFTLKGLVILVLSAVILIIIILIISSMIKRRRHRVRRYSYRIRKKR